MNQRFILPLFLISHIIAFFMPSSNVFATVDASRLMNISTRSFVGTGDDVEIGGFIIGGSLPKTVVVRGRGPSMGGAPFNIQGTLSNPFLQVYSFAQGAYIAQNDNWETADPSNLCGTSGYVCGDASAITATGIDPCIPNPGESSEPPGCHQESAILITLPPGNYGAVLSGIGVNPTGIGLVEVFDTDGSTLERLTNISTRASVQTGDSVEIGGFIIGGGTGSKTILIRARGPSMSGAPFNIAGTLANPTVMLYSFTDGAYIVQNDDWETNDPQQLCTNSGYACGGEIEISNTGIDPCQPNPGETSAPPGCYNESAMLVTLPPGNYGAVVSGVSGGTGVGLVEFFEVTLDIPLTNFGGQVIPYNFYTPAVADLNGDGFIEALGTFNDGNGNLSTASYTTMGLSGLFVTGRRNRDCRIADFNSDGYQDIVCNTYSAEEVYTSSDPTCQLNANTYSSDSVAKLYFNNGYGIFTENTGFTQLGIKGFGETIVVADFDNDLDIDIFIPYYSFCSSNEHSYLLMNDGVGNFIDISDSAGVSLRNIPIGYRAEGAQALDFDLDGDIDFYVASHLFINNGNMTFTDRRAAMGLPRVFDEGIKFIDWNNDGYLDLVIHDPTTGPALYQYNGQTFSLANVVPAYTYNQSYGMNISDLNNDGREDIFTSGGSINNTVILLNNGTDFKRSNPTAMDSWGNDLMAFADINKDGGVDILKRVQWDGIAYYQNRTDIPANSFFYVEIVGPNGEKNQQGRVIKIYPQNHPGTIMTRVVESGSGYMAQGQYDILVGTPYPEPHRVEVYFASGIREFMINPGERKRVFPNGDMVDY